ncbi:MAG TPA: cation transporter dimerization domain-containing protein, partial [Telmatospirillum sp.]|nr:cation transporter dimerization domain-containing protein [Telmatospirillum sp.]
IDGVARVDRVRARPAGTTTFVEVLIRVSRSMPLARVQDVCDALSSTISHQLPGTDAFVKAEPLTLDDESIIETVHVVAGKRHVTVHDIFVEVLAGCSHVSFDIEVDETMNIHDAHEVASAVEQAVRDELGEDVLVETHIDPKRVSILTGVPVDADVFQRLEREVLDCAGAVDDVREVHGIHIRHGAEGLYISLHCLFCPVTSVRTAHHATAVIEQRIRERIAGVGRVVVHAEPQGSDD